VSVGAFSAIGFIVFDSVCWKRCRFICLHFIYELNDYFLQNTRFYQD